MKQIYLSLFLVAACSFRSMAQHEQYPQSDPNPVPAAVEQYLLTPPTKLFAKTVYRNRLAVQETARELAASIKAALAKPVSGDW